VVDVQVATEKELIMTNKIKIEINDSTTAYNKNIAIEMESEETGIKELNTIARKDLDELSKS
tara:strand:- start:1009 stop:1194 length:186 start_codon:yes stop_codon:yes gene_type:complete